MQNEEEYCYYSGLPAPLAYATHSKTTKIELNEIDRIIEMAWEDRTPFEAIRQQFGLTEAEVKSLMKNQLRYVSYVRWRKRVETCQTKHLRKRSGSISRFRSKSQRLISGNRISKRRT